MNYQTMKVSVGNRAWIAALALAATAVVPSAHAIQISVQPASTLVAPGSGVDVSLVISGLGSGGAPSLGAFDLNLTFDPAVLTYDSLTFGDPGLGNQLALTSPSSEGSGLDSVAGLVNLYSVSLDSVSDLDSLQAGGFILASLHFTASGAGLSLLTLSNVILGDSVGDPLIPDSVLGSFVQSGVSSVPDGGMYYPGMFLLAFSAGCAWVRNRRNRDAKATVS